MSLKSTVKRGLATVFSLRPSAQSRDILLLYHSIGDSPLALPAAAFARQMDWLQATAAVVPVSELLTTPGRNKLRAAITFDDGYRSLHRQAMPILNAVGAPAAAFLCTGWIGERERRASVPEQGHYPGEEFLLWREVEDLASAGWEIGAHGINHLDLTVQSDDRVTSELANSRLRIAEALGACLPVFAYTWGRHTARLRRLVAGAGYAYALAGIHGPVMERSDPFAIPRINISRDCSFDDFRSIVRGDWDYLGWYQQVRLTRKINP